MWPCRLLRFSGAEPSLPALVFTAVKITPEQARLPSAGKIGPFLGEHALARHHQALGRGHPTRRGGTANQAQGCAAEAIAHKDARPPVPFQGVVGLRSSTNQPPPRGPAMTAPTSNNAPHLRAESSYGPTHAAPDGGARRPAPAAATDADTEVHQWQHAHGRSDRPPAQTQPTSPDPAQDPAATLDRLPEVLTAPEAAAVLRIARDQLYQAVARGQLRALRIGRTIRIPKQALLDLLATGGPGTASGDEQSRQPAP
jgi:excisionase family DNA binding protein